MPPKRTTRAAARRSQPGQGTLSFSKGQAPRVTKQTTSPRSKSSKKDLSSEPAHTSPDVATVSAPPTAADPSTDETPTTTASVLGGRSSPELDTAPTDPETAQDDTLASSLSPSDLKSYWRAKESARKAPRVHQSELSLGEKILREWDMSGQFGPCIGISREGRWRRAKRLGLEPPIEVLAVIKGGLDGREDVEGRAYVDVLMGNRYEVVA